MNARSVTPLSNGYEFIDGVAMNTDLGERFSIVNPYFKKYIGPGNLVEVRIDSPRFSMHPDAPVDCTCEHCKEPATKPILCHDEPRTILYLPRQEVPSRGWGEQFWFQVGERDGDLVTGTIDNELYETKLHSLSLGDEITVHIDHILALHPSHNEEMLMAMTDEDLAGFQVWLTENGWI